ncbi:hypothetical protein FDX19_21915 [Citrobacter sp. wls619]|uniref:hypothetical protein n=1 Tax=Citrobacter sp. wls619 TaxID=2576432 RepID=UPI0010C95B98|nr:hypothetical protein [Citrobacter sp. wls619]TKV05707.1 hypothetical protein FDX19_21915 [Citrobacter sp. wls619]
MNKTKTETRRVSWTVEELRFLEEHTGTMTQAEMAKHLGRTRLAVKATVRALGRGKAWTEAELDIVQTRCISQAGITQALPLLPGRERPAVFLMAVNMGLISDGCRNWSEAEARMLEKYYPSEGSSVASRLPGRTPAAVIIQAGKLGIVFEGSQETFHQRWSDEEKRLLERNRYLPLAKLTVLFPERTKASVRSYRQLLNKRRDSTSCHSKMNEREKGAPEARNHHTDWNDEDSAFLETWYGTMSTELIAEILGRSRRAIKLAVRNRMVTGQVESATGISLSDSRSKLVQRKWSQEEWQRLEANHHLPLAELTALFPGRTPMAVRGACSRLTARRKKTGG